MKFEFNGLGRAMQFKLVQLSIEEMNTDLQSF